METRANLVTVGLFVLAVIAAGFFGAYWLLKGGQTGPRATVAVVFSGSVGGLVPGAAVGFNGIKIGEVNRVTFAPDDPGHVIAYLNVDANAPVKTDSHAALTFSGLTGYASVQITGGSAGSPRLLDQKEGIPQLNADVTSVQDLVQGAKQIMGRADETLSTVQRLIQENGPALTKTIKNAETFSDTLAKNSENIDKFMASVGQAADVISKISGKVETLSTDLDTLVKAVDRDKVAKVVDDAAKISGNLAQSSDKVSATIEQAQAALKNVDQLTANLNNAISDARNVIAAVDPKKIASAVDDVNKVSSYLAGRTQDFDDLLTHAKSAATSIDTFSGEMAKKTADVNSIIDDTKSAMHQIEIASHRVDGILAHVDGLVGSEEGKGLFAQGRTFLTEATEAAKAFKDMSNTFNAKAGDITAALSQFTSQGLREVKDFVSDSRRTMSTIDRAVADFNRNPQQLIFGNNRGTVPEYGPGRR